MLDFWGSDHIRLLHRESRFYRYFCHILTSSKIQRVTSQGLLNSQMSKPTSPALKFDFVFLSFHCQALSPSLHHYTAFQIFSSKSDFSWLLA